MIPPHIESIPSLLVIKVHKVVLIVVYYVVLFFGLRGMQRGVEWKEKRRGIGERVYSKQRGTLILNDPSRFPSTPPLFSPTT